MHAHQFWWAWPPLFRIFLLFLFLLQEPEYTNVCFWFIPPSLRDVTDPQVKRDKLNGVAPKIKARLMSAGTLMLGYQPLGKYTLKLRNLIIIIIITR